METINNILGFSKLESGKMKLDNQDFHLRHIVQSIMELLSAKSSEKGLDYKCFLEPDFPVTVKGDSGKIRQVLMNFISNAIKFTQKGEVSLYGRLMEENESSVRLKFEVKDTGIGISEEVLKGLFKPFTQADTSTTRKYGGTGLGLAICRNLVEMMKGEIQVESVPGKGSTFSFTVPLDKAVRNYTSDIPDPVPSGPVVSKDLDSGKSLRILLAEDDITNQKVAKSMLAKLGWTVVDVVENGIEAIETLRNEAYDVVLMDCKMPEMDGFEATKILRDSERKTGTPPIWIVALTANALDGDRTKCIDVGMNDYLSKPFTPAELTEVLEKVPISKDLETHFTASVR
ncbi:MAG TPA: response regulator [Verrucomicrobiales bacterium]|nr:response regulator [Verrucomicrobiales bacterium]HIL71897.1 response regulator [Verrucomicrobiota bacterium]